MRVNTADGRTTKTLPDDTLGPVESPNEASITGVVLDRSGNDVSVVLPSNAVKPARLGARSNGKGEQLVIQLGSVRVTVLAYDTGQAKIEVRHTGAVRYAHALSRGKPHG